MANGHGGARPGAGRKKGTPNKVPNEERVSLTLLAQSYTAEALEVLADVMRKGASEAARVSAANSILDRGHGKPAQVIPEGDGDEAAALSIKITTAAPVSDVRVTRPDS